MAASGLNRIIADGAGVERLNNEVDFIFTEGPVWDKSGALLFSDIGSSITYRMSPSGVFSTFREGTNSGNGLAFNAWGNLLTCEGGRSAVTMFDMRIGDVTVLAGAYNGTPLNAPNDLVVTRSGGIFFSDPAFGELKQDAEAVYFINPDGELKRVWQGAVRPNGVALSSDESTLYVSATFENKIYALSIDHEGSVVDSRTFGELEATGTPMLAGMDGIHVPLEGYPDASIADGLAIDMEGNLYVTTQIGVQVLDRNGDLLGTIAVPEQPANCCFGGEDMKSLFITATSSVYRINLSVLGISFPQS